MRSYFKDDFMHPVWAGFLKTFWSPGLWKAIGVTGFQRGPCKVAGWPLEAAEKKGVLSGQVVQPSSGHRI